VVPRACLGVLEKRITWGPCLDQAPTSNFFPVYIVTISIEPSRFPQIPLTLLLYLGKYSDYVFMCWTIKFRFPVLIILSRTAFTDGVMPTQTSGQWVVKALASDVRRSERDTKN